MEKEEFWKKYNQREFDILFSAHQKGVTLSFDVEEEAKFASWGKDYELLHFLWRIGAKGETPFIEQVFDRFRNGETFSDMLKEKARLEKEKRDSAKADLTSFDSVKDIPIGEIGLKLHDHSEYYLHIDIENYIYNNDVVEPDGLHFGPLSINQDLSSNGKMEFDQHEFDESIYLFHCHNPVSLKSMEFIQLNEQETLLKMNLLFNFEFERNGENQMLLLEKIVQH